MTRLVNALKAIDGLSFDDVGLFLTHILGRPSQSPWSAWAAILMEL